MKFTKVPATALSLSKRSLLCGVGVNDAPYVVYQKINGKRIKCPAYQAWKAMLTRCYYVKNQERHPTYKGCSVAKEWLVFSVFLKWYESNYIEGFDLDKDIKVKGNKVYGPDTCLVLPRCINTLFTNVSTKKDGYPTGVYLSEAVGRFAARIRIDGNRKHLGLFDTPELAHESYIKAKNAEIHRKCEQYPDLAVYLVNHLL